MTDYTRYEPGPDSEGLATLHCADCEPTLDSVPFPIWVQPRTQATPLSLANLIAAADEHERQCHAAAPKPDRYWSIWDADRKELWGQVAGPDLVDADAALRQFASMGADYEWGKSRSHIEETDEAGYNAVSDWDLMGETEKADLRLAVSGE